MLKKFLVAQIISLLKSIDTSTLNGDFSQQLNNTINAVNNALSGLVRRSRSLKPTV